MLVVDGNTLRLVHVLNLSHQAVLKVGDRFLSRIHQRLAAAQVLEEALEQLVGVDRTIGEQLTGRDLLAVADHHIASEQDRVFADGIVTLNHGDGDRIVVVSLLDLNRAGLFAQHRRLARSTGLQQFLNPGQTLNDVPGLLTFKHQQGQTVSPLNQITVPNVQNRIGRHHVGTTKTQSDAVALHVLNFTAEGAGLGLRQQFAINDALTDRNHGFAGGADGGGVIGTFHDQAAHRLRFSGLRQLGHTSLLAENLRGGDHLAGLDGDTILNLKLGVG